MTTKIRTEDEIAKDGETVRVPMFMMDAQQRAVAESPVVTNDAAIGHRPGSLPVTDADRERRTALYRGHDEKLSARWQSTPPPVNPTDAKRPTGDARLNAYAALSGTNFQRMEASMTQKSF